MNISEIPKYQIRFNLEMRIAELSVTVIAPLFSVTVLTKVCSYLVVMIVHVLTGSHTLN